jgi:hypothetical protein
MRFIANEGLIEETKDLSSSLLATSLFVVHDSSRGGKDNEAELTRWEEVVDPGFNVSLLDVEAGRNDTALVESSNQLDNNLAGAMVVNDFEFANVSWY